MIGRARVNIGGTDIREAKKVGRARDKTGRTDLRAAMVDG